MGILLFTLLGLSLGFLAHALFSGGQSMGRQSMGIVVTAVLGTIGSLVGGPLANLLASRPLFDLNVAGFVGSVVCGIALLVAVGAKGRRRGLGRGGLSIAALPRENPNPRSRNVTRP